MCDTDAALSTPAYQSCEEDISQIRIFFPKCVFILFPFFFKKVKNNSSNHQNFKTYSFMSINSLIASLSHYWDEIYLHMYLMTYIYTTKIASGLVASDCL